MNQKGLDLLIKAYSLLAPSFSIPLLLAGNGNSREVSKIDSLIKRYRLQKCIKIVGRINGKRKYNLFRNAYAIIVPSRFETYSLTALEALSLGIPLITFNIEGLQWIPPKLAIKCKPFSVKSLAKNIHRLYKDSQLQRLLSIVGRKQFRNQSWDVIANSYHLFFQSILFTYGSN
jgi:glycosyltransferase involved in cell wall biosynthesis